MPHSINKRLDTKNALSGLVTFPRKEQIKNLNHGSSPHFEVMKTVFLTCHSLALIIHSLFRDRDCLKYVSELDKRVMMSMTNSTDNDSDEKHDHYVDYYLYSVAKMKEKIN